MRLDEPALVIRIEERELNYFTIDRLRDILAAAATRKRVVIDLTNVAYMDSVSLGVLVELYRERVIKRQLPPFVLAANKEGVRQVLEVTGFDALWPTFEDLGAAIRAAEAEQGLQEL